MTKLTKNSLDYLSTVSGLCDFIGRSAEMFWKHGLSTIQFFHFQRFCDKSLHRFIRHKYLCSVLRSVSLSNSGLSHPCCIPLVPHARVFKSIISMFLHCISMISPQLYDLSVPPPPPPCYNHLIIATIFFQPKCKDP